MGSAWSWEFEICRALESGRMNVKNLLEFVKKFQFWGNEGLLYLFVIIKHSWWWWILTLPLVSCVISVFSVIHIIFVICLVKWGLGKNPIDIDQMIILFYMLLWWPNEVWDKSSMVTVKWCVIGDNIYFTVIYCYKMCWYELWCNIIFVYFNDEIDDRYRN